MSNYYYLDGEQNQQGPFTRDEMQALLGELRIGQQTQVFREGDTEWRTAHHFPELVVRPRSSVSIPSQSFMQSPQSIKSAPPQPAKASKPDQAQQPIPSLTWGCGLLLMVIGSIIAFFLLLFLLAIIRSI